MRSGRKKEKMVGYNTVPPPEVLMAAAAGNGVLGSANAIGMSSVAVVGGGSSSSHTSASAAAAVNKQEKPSYNACPPPPNLYGPTAAPPPAPPVSEKATGKANSSNKGGGGAAAATANAPTSSSGNTSDGEKKGRRRPGRKSRQVDSVSIPNSSGDSVVTTSGKSEAAEKSELAEKSEGGGMAGQLSQQEIDKQAYGSSYLPSPSPSATPNPSFKVKLESSTDSLIVSIKSSSRSECRNVDLSAAEQSSSSSSKLSVSMVSPPLDALSCTVESATGQKTKTKQTLPIGIPKSKSKEGSRSSKSNAVTGPKRSGSLGVDPKQSSLQKGWRMCAPSGSTALSVSGSFDVGDSSGVSCAGDGLEASPPLGCSPISRSWPGSGNLAAPAVYMSGPPDKVTTNGGNSYGSNSSRSSQFDDHMTLDEATQCIEDGTAFRGVLRVNPHYRSEAYLTLEGVPTDVLIDGLTSQNRAMEGDVVVVQLNPVSYWPRLKGTNNNKQSSRSSVVDDSTFRALNPAENGGLPEISDDVPDHDLDGRSEFSPVSNWDSQDTVEGQALSDCVGAFSLGQCQPRPPEGGGWDDPIPMEQDSSGGHVSCKRSGNSKAGVVSEGRLGSAAEEVLENGGVDAAGRTISEQSLAKLAALVASMPSKRPTGRVVAIVGKSSRREAVIGFLEAHGSNCGGGGGKGNSSSDFSPQKPGKKQSNKFGGIVNFVPIDSRFSKMVVFGSGIPEQLSKRIKDGDPTVSNELVVAQVEGWKADSSLPRASVKQTLGPGGTIEAQTEAILCENSIHRAEFPDAALACLPAVPWQIPAQEVKKRRDFRGLRIFTIDPPTAKDLDDALSVEELDNGMLRIGVHIADVSFFVKSETALDKEAQKRSTSVYLIQKVLPMLPPLLCEELCSLNPGVDRLAFSVVWTMDQEGSILEQWIGRSVICSCAKLTYGHAQAMIDEKNSNRDDEQWELELSSNGARLPLLHGGCSWQTVVSDVRKLHEVAKRRRESRFDGGALKLENSKLVFSLDEDGEPYDSRMYQHQDSNFLVEEFMLLANMTVARVISSAFPERALLRRHPEPNMRKLKEFEEFCTKNGFELDTSSSGALHLSLETMREKFQEDPILFNILMLYATKPMQLAKYFCTGDLKGQEEDWGHYALAVPLYTHFTSPIRRYPDLVVHRTVAAALEAERAISKDGTLLKKGSGQPECGKALQCFSGPAALEGIIDVDIAKKALVVAAGKYKIPELSELSLVAAHCNERRLASRNVKEATDKLYLWSMLRKKQGMLSSARVLALGPKFMSLYVCKIAMERRIYYDEIEGLNTEWFEATGTLVLSFSPEKPTHNNKKYGQTKGKPKRTVADVALLVNPTDSLSVTSQAETYEDLIREVEDRLAGKILSEEEGETVEDAKGGGSDVEVEPAVLPLTLRWFTSVPVSIHAIGGENRPLDIAVRLYASSYAS